MILWYKEWSIDIWTPIDIFENIIVVLIFKMLREWRWYFGQFLHNFWGGNLLLNLFLCRLLLYTFFFFVLFISQQIPYFYFPLWVTTAYCLPYSFVHIFFLIVLQVDFVVLQLLWLHVHVSLLYCSMMRNMFSLPLKGHPNPQPYQGCLGVCHSLEC